MTTRNSPTVEPAEREFVISRVFDAPRELVWKAWTEAPRLAQWWGPKGCTIRVVKLDVRPGGMFHYAMQFKPGHDMWGRFIYREIAAPERLVYVSSFSDAKGGITRAPFPKISETWPREVLNTLILSEQGGKTTLTLRGSPINATEEEFKTFAGMFASMRQGFSGTFDQLAAYLAKS
ncbi:MAG TPA: SRPBCC domain-containing protein [Hyphomicrobiaceae bacterium]|nr:SRPBCC domain-containing protein [Hyphomicrobiaceae bacterium]